MSELNRESRDRPGRAPNLGVPPTDALTLGVDAAVLSLAEAADVPLDLGLSRAATAASLAAGHAPIEVLRRSCEAVGLSAVTLRCSTRALLAHGPSRALPAVGVHGSVMLLVSARSTHRARVQQPSLKGAAEELSLEAVAARLGAEGPDTPIDWLITSPASPLQSLAAHGHGAHDDHGHPTAFQRVRALLRMERDDLWVVLVYAVAVGLLSLATPIAVQALVNSVAFGALLQPIVVLTIIVFAVLGFAALLRALQVRIVEAIQRRIFVRVALDVAHRLPRVDLGATDPRYGPELVNRFFDVLTVQKSASIFLLDGLALLLQAAIGLLVLAFYHPALLALDAVLLVGISFVVFYQGHGAPETSINESRAKYAVAAWLEEIARHPKTFRASSGADLASSRADLLALRYLDARSEHFRVVYRQVVGSLTLQVLASAAVLGLGGALVINRQLTLGQLVAAELIVTTVVASLAKLGKHLETWYDLLAAADKLGHLADLPLEVRGSARDFRDDARGASVRMRDVSFQYPGGAEALSGVTLDLAPGARAVVTGVSGAGKSSLASLLFGLRLPSSGHIEIDGVDLREVDVGALRERVSVLSHDLEVLEGTVFENICLGRPWMTRRDVWDALRRVGLERQVRALPQGLDSALAANGAPLNYSASARLMVARAIAGAPRLLVVDGGLASFDARYRAVLEEALFDRAAPWTLLVLTSPSDPIVGRADLTLALPAPATEDLENAV
ncbi:MAG: ABC transporter ATP-binding protein [Polyangiales bacterium]